MIDKAIELPKKCPVCKNELKIVSPYRDGAIHSINCEYCGNFTIDEHNSGLNSDVRHLIAGYLYSTKDYYLSNRERIDHINKENVDKILKSQSIPKTICQKLDKFLLNLSQYGQNYGVPDSIDWRIPQIAFARDMKEFNRFLELLFNYEYLESDGMFSVKGLERIELLLSSKNVTSRKVFIAMDFGDDKDIIRDKGIKPACFRCGYEAITVDEKQHNGDITEKIKSEIETSKFVIADFTYDNYGVYYEAGYAEGCKIPVIKTCREDWFNTKKPHFDINHDYFVVWKDDADLVKKLEERIRETIP